MLLVQAGSGAATLGLPDSPGVPAAVTADTLSCAFNDLKAVEEIFDRHRGRIAAVIVEPVAGNMGVILPEPGFLQGLRAVTKADGALLVFDEVMTGFRVHPGGAQALYGVTPDLSTLGKVIGGGMPVGAYGGRSDIMALVAPAGPMYQAGTLSGNPLAMSAGIQTLKELALPGVWERLEKTTAELADGLSRAARAAGIPHQVSHVGSMFGLFFSADPVKDWESAKKSDTARFSRYFRRMLEEGVYLAPSQFEAGFVSTAHGAAEVAATVKAAEMAFSGLG
jgi:glutamate-1-semialdehyde 2,1-aminomutase